jgi:hypothetical protein
MRSEEGEERRDGWKAVSAMETRELRLVELEDATESVLAKRESWRL